MFEMKNAYKVSIIAKRMVDLSIPEGDYRLEHEPFIVRAESMEQAKSAIEMISFDRWKKEEGWQEHEARISPVTMEDWTAITGIQQRGPVFSRSSEEPITVKLD